MVNALLNPTMELTLSCPKTVLQRNLRLVQKWRDDRCLVPTNFYMSTTTAIVCGSCGVDCRGQPKSVNDAHSIA